MFFGALIGFFQQNILRCGVNFLHLSYQVIIFKKGDCYYGKQTRFEKEH